MRVSPRSALLLALFLSGLNACTGMAAESSTPEFPSSTSNAGKPERSAKLLPLAAASAPQAQEQRQAEPEAPGPSLEAREELAPTSAPAAEKPTRQFQQPVVETHLTRAVILLYHGFDRGPDPLSVSSSNFRKQMQWLADNRIEVVHLSELIQFLQGKIQLPEKVTVITIDDGMRSVYEKAWPILKEYNYPFSLGICTASIEEGSIYAMSWEQIRELSQSELVEIASHGHRHRGLARIPEKLMLEELNLSRELLEKHLGITPEAYFYPLGSFDRRANEMVLKHGYTAAFTASGAPIAFGSASMTTIPRTTIFHKDSLGQFSWFFGASLKKLPPILHAPNQKAEGTNSKH